jgi:hypothetical protein
VFCDPKVLDHVVYVGEDAHEGNRFADSTHGCQGSAGSPHALQTESALGNLPRMVNCLVGNGGVRFREPACCAPAMASAAVSELRNWWVGVVFRSDAPLLLEFGGSRLNC